MLSICLPFFQKWNDGSARTPCERINLSAAGLLSPITLRKATFLYFSLNSSNLGAMILHGPHHDALQQILRGQNKIGGGRMPQASVSRPPAGRAWTNA